MEKYGWVVFALLGALFAAVVNVSSKRAMERMDHVVALVIQASLMLGTLLVILVCRGCWSDFKTAPKWALGLMAFSGVAAGAAWFFGYRALQMATVNQATPIDKLSMPLAVILAMVLLKETPSGLNWLGIGLMLVGAYFVAHTSGTA